MKTNLKIIMLCLILITMISIVFAANNETKTAQDNNSGKNMTYGKCVSAGAIVKNACYDTSKTNLKTCKDAAAIGQDSKNALKQCNDAYKKEKNQCKQDFKFSKNECKKIKHNFFETLGSSMK